MRKTHIFTSEQDNFSIDFPRQPEYQSQTSRTPIGIVTDHDYELYDDKHTIYFGVTVRSLPYSLTPKKKRLFFDAFTKSVIQNQSSLQNGKVTQMRDISLNKFPGKEIVFSKFDRVSMKGKICMYVIHNKVYEMMALEPGFQYPSVTSERFFQSFRLNQGT